MGGKRGDKGGNPDDGDLTPPGGHEPSPKPDDNKPDPANENPWDHQPIGSSVSWTSRPEVTDRGTGWGRGGEN